MVLSDQLEAKDVSVTSVSSAAPDKIVKEQEVAFRKPKLSIQAVEKNNKIVRLLPQVSNNRKNWFTAKYSETQEYWEIPANSSDLIFFDDCLVFRYFRLMGYLATAGEAIVDIYIVLK